ncbi:MAG: class C sortase [Gordonibacter sp.]|uniref:class C sortase n=1 Tax=Gordonibacter sp. TaxID=1968902 RepID=UPI002FCB59DD
MKQRIQSILLALMFLMGLGVLLYPTVSGWVNARLSVVEADAYEANVGNLTDEQLAAEWQKARAYNESLMGDPLHDPFVPGSGAALPGNYTECLNVDGIMAYVEVPSIGVKLPIRHGTSEEVLADGVGHIESTALPTGGEDLHPVITSHTGLPEARLFTDLEKLVEGDFFCLHVLDQQLWYQVDQITVIVPEELDQLRAVEGHDYVTLLTCTPYGVNSHRLLVRGERCDAPDQQPVAQPALPWELAVAAGVGALLLLAGAALVVRRRCSRRKHATRGGRDGQA